MSEGVIDVDLPPAAARLRLPLGAGVDTSKSPALDLPFLELFRARGVSKSGAGEFDSASRVTLFCALRSFFSRARADSS